MSLSTTLNKRKGEGSGALLFLFTLYLGLIFISCGIPSPVYLAPPDSISDTAAMPATQLSFSHADRNDPAIFQGYELFYHFFDESDPPADYSDPAAWTAFAEDYLTLSQLTNSSSAVMSFAAMAPPVFRRFYTGDEGSSLLGSFVVMIPVDPGEVDLSGTGSDISIDIKQDSDELVLEASVPVFSAPSETTSPVTYPLASLTLRRVVRNTESGVPTAAPFYEPGTAPDDQPDGVDRTQLDVALFAVTTGFDSFGTRIVSRVEYLGILD